MTNFASMAGNIITITSFLALIIKLFLSYKQLREGLKALLRSDMLKIYYKCKPSSAISQYEFECFELEYKAYKALGGNSFIDKVWDEIQKWDVIK